MKRSSAVGFAQISGGSNAKWRRLIAGALLAVAFLAISCGEPAPEKRAESSNTSPTTSQPSTAATNSAPQQVPQPAPAKEVTTASGLKYTDLVVGTGESPKTGQMVTVHYTGTFLDGKKFDSSRDTGRPYPFRIGTGVVIKGWDEGVMSMKVGGKRKLIVPASLGYGAQGYPGAIPPNTTLVFEVELLGVK